MAEESLFHKLGLSKIFDREKMAYHFVFVEIPEELVAPEIAFWGEASWWPPKSSLKFTRKTFGELKLGTRYEKKFQGLVPFRCELEVTKLIPGQEIERTFTAGALQGYESLVVDGRYNGTKINYRLRFKVQGILNKLLWFLFVGGMHGRSVRMALSSLKGYLQTKAKGSPKSTLENQSEESKESS